MRSEREQLISDGEQLRQQADAAQQRLDHHRLTAQQRDLAELQRLDAEASIPGPHAGPDRRRGARGNIGELAAPQLRQLQQTAQSLATAQAGLSAIATNACTSDAAPVVLAEQPLALNETVGITQASVLRVGATR